MFKRSEKMKTDNNYHTPAKRAKIDNSPQYSGVRETETSRNSKIQYDDLWGDDFAKEDIEEIDFVASQACLQEGNLLDNSKLHRDGSSSFKSDLFERPTTSRTICNVALQSNLTSANRSDLWLRRDIPGTSRITQEIEDINYSQFRTKLINGKDHNSTFRRESHFIVPDDKELEKLKAENKKLLNDFITKDGETVFLRQQLQQIQLQAENEKLEKMRIIEEQSNCHRSEISKICKEKEQLKTHLELQNLEIGNLLERCKLLESGNIKLKEPQSLHMNNSFNKSKCNISNWSISKNSLKVKEMCVQANIYKKSDCQLKTCNTSFFLTGVSELMFKTSVPEKPIINFQVIEKTGRRNLPILQEEETFRIFENPDLVKPIVTIVDGKKLTTEFILLDIVDIEKKVSAEIESESCIPIFNKLALTTRELMLNVIMVLQTIFQAMKNDDIRDMNDLYFSTLYKNHIISIKSECEADAWHEGEHGIEARRMLGALSHIALESSYLSNYLAGKLQLRTHSDKCYNRYLQQMVRYNTWTKKGHQFEMLEMFLECVTLIGRVRRSHQFTGLISAIVKVLCNVQEKVGYCEKGLEYISLIFKELIFSRPLSLCYVSLAKFLVIFSKCDIFMSKLCRNPQSLAIKNWKGALHFTPDACVLQIFVAQMEHFHLDFLTTVNMTHALMSFIQYVLQTTNNPLRIENSESCNCYKKLLQFIIIMLRRCSETRLDIIDNTEWQNPLYINNKCYTLEKINYKDYTCRTNCNTENIEKRQVEDYPEKLDRNFWLDIRKTQHKMLKEGIRFLCHITISNPDFIIRSPDVENSFHLFLRNITFFNDLILHENEREALDRIKITFNVDKSAQGETEMQHKNIHVSKLSLTSFKKKVTPATRNNDIKKLSSAESLNRVYMAIKALYNSKTEYKDN